MEQSVQNAFTASRQIAGPSSFTEFGAPVVADVIRSQSHMRDANRISAPPPKTSADVRNQIRMAPQVVPLNVTDAEYSSCCQRGTDALQPVVVPAPRLAMPPRAPVVDLVRSDSLPSYAAPSLPVKYDAIVSRGMAGWGDMAMRCPQQVRIERGVNWGTAALFGLAVVGIFAVTRK
jgi:hypothetical protein